jgi:G6PDH family F420-dependent oxidoreductase
VTAAEALAPNVRLERPRGNRRRHHPAAAPHGRHLPDLAHPSGDRGAAATTATLLPGRFALGVGTGENLNEHVTGQKWPTIETRREMLEEAVEVIRLLWKGGSHDHRGRHYTVENARLYSLPDEPPPIFPGHQLRVATTR